MSQIQPRLIPVLVLIIALVLGYYWKARHVLERVAVELAESRRGWLLIRPLVELKVCRQPLSF
jgi:hypothetical protein